jgi:iron complex transport system substrate-binding protein
MHSLVRFGLTASLALSSTVAGAATFPLTVKNCGQSETFLHPPARVVTVGQHETELLLALGLGNRIAGTSVWFGKLPTELEQAGKNLKRLADNAPGFEAVAAQKPIWFLRSTAGILALRVRLGLASSLSSWV